MPNARVLQVGVNRLLLRRQRRSLLTVTRAATNVVGARLLPATEVLPLPA